MFLTILTFLGSPIGKFCAWVLGILSVSAVLLSLLAIHDHNIRTQATLEYNQKQLEQITIDQQRYILDTQKLTENSAKQADLLNKQQETLDKKLGSVNNYFSTLPVDEQNKSASPLLKDLFKQLGTVK
ncbi:MAG: hypothetical protein P4L79_10845 [Legionella sp.]|uniref:hypothetical protein n=1 Tax=Legionella sp. TaxID=459 RepID=UPI00284D4594|nr:hypothetical protein [Legionella sp.]